MVNCSGRVAPRATCEGNVESAPSFGRDPSEAAAPRPAADVWTTSNEATTNQNAALVARRTSRSLTGATTVSDAVARARRIVACRTRSESSRRHCRDRRRALGSVIPGRLCLAEPEYRPGALLPQHTAPRSIRRGSPAQATPVDLVDLGVTSRNPKCLRIGRDPQTPGAGSGQAAGGSAVDAVDVNGIAVGELIGERAVAHRNRPVFAEHGGGGVAGTGDRERRCR
jgi:hypothetical protein